MASAGSNTVRVTAINANWTADPPNSGRFEFLLVTEDEQRHSVEVSPNGASALLELFRTSPVLLWDPDAEVLIAANLVGDWLPSDWSAHDPREHD